MKSTVALKTCQQPYNVATTSHLLQMTLHICNDPIEGRIVKVVVLKVSQIKLNIMYIKTSKMKTEIPLRFMYVSVYCIAYLKLYLYLHVCPADKIFVKGIFDFFIMLFTQCIFNWAFTNTQVPAYRSIYMYKYVGKLERTPHLTR